MGKYSLYTDGSCSNDGLGGWAFIIVDEWGNPLRQVSGRATQTTVNRMELNAVLSGLKKFDPNTAQVQVFSDSAYVVNCFLQRWYETWKLQNWHTSKGPVKNLDLWIPLLQHVAKFKHPIQWTHVRGHTGNPFNELCDQLAQQARKGVVIDGPVKWDGISS